ncbi:MAG TPA: NADH-quinone oxidoreductase subunit NuoK [Rectinemataceae bacterium]|nr:NADH-quinone oxidoreductase subunit NuoK [Rectinemataceae bacterium]
MGAITLNHYIFLATALFSVGVAGVLIRRNILIILMSIELMLNAVNILLAATSAFKGDSDGQVFVFFIMLVAAAEIAAGLAILTMIYRNSRSIDINHYRNLKG